MAPRQCSMARPVGPEARAHKNAPVGGVPKMFAKWWLGPGAGTRSIMSPGPARPHRSRRIPPEGPRRACQATTCAGRKQTESNSQFPVFGQVNLSPKRALDLPGDRPGPRLSLLLLLWSLLALLLLSLAGAVVV